MVKVYNWFFGSSSTSLVPPTIKFDQVLLSYKCNKACVKGEFPLSLPYKNYSYEMADTYPGSAFIFWL